MFSVSHTLATKQPQKHCPQGAPGWTEKAGHTQSTGSGAVRTAVVREEVFSQIPVHRAQLVPRSVPNHRKSRAQASPPPPSPQPLRTKCQAAASQALPRSGETQRLWAPVRRGGGGVREVNHEHWAQLHSLVLRGRRVRQADTHAWA